MFFIYKIFARKINFRIFNQMELLDQILIKKPIRPRSYRKSLLIPLELELEKKNKNERKPEIFKNDENQLSQTHITNSKGEILISLTEFKKELDKKLFDLGEKIREEYAKKLLESSFNDWKERNTQELYIIEKIYS